MGNRTTDRETDRKTDRQAGKQTEKDRQILTGRETSRQGKGCAGVCE